MSETETGAERVFDADYVGRLRKESANHRIQRNEARQEVEELRSSGADLEKARQELEAIQKEIAALKKAEVDKAIRAEVFSLAEEAGAVDPEDCLKLLDPETIAGDPANVPKALADLLAARPWLVKGPPQPPPPSPGAGGPPIRTKPSADQQFAALLRRGVRGAKGEI